MVKVTVGAMAALDAGETLTINGTRITLQAATKPTRHLRNAA